MGPARRATAGQAPTDCNRGAAAVVAWGMKLPYATRLEEHPHAPRCAMCGYCLLGNVTGVCPECGARWRPAKQRVKRLSPGMMMLIGLAGCLVTGVMAAWLSPPPLLSGREQSKEKRAESAVRRIGPIAKGLETFRWDMGRYPTTQEGLGALFGVCRDPRGSRCGPSDLRSDVRPTSHRTTRGHSRPEWPRRRTDACKRAVARPLSRPPEPAIISTS